MSKAIFLTREVGKTRGSAELAANLWADRALRVQVKTDGIDLGRQYSDPPLDLAPRFYGYRVFGAMREELNRVYFPRTPDLRGVWTSDMVASEPGFAEVERRGHMPIDRFTGVGRQERVWYCTFLVGICTFTVRYPASVEHPVRIFVRMLSNGWAHLGAHRTVSGAVDVLQVEDITVAEAKAWEAHARAPQTTRVSRFAGPARQLVEIYGLDEVDEDALKDAFRPLVAESSKLGAATAILILATKSARRGIWWRPLQRLPQGLTAEQGQLEVLFHRELLAHLRILPDMRAVREYLEEIVKAAREAAAEKEAAAV